MQRKLRVRDKAAETQKLLCYIHTAHGKNAPKIHQKKVHLSLLLQRYRSPVSSAAFCFCVRTPLHFSLRPPQVSCLLLDEHRRKNTLDDDTCCCCCRSWGEKMGLQVKF